MYFKVRKLGAQPGDDLIVNISKMAKIEELMMTIKDKLDLDVDKQRLFYKGKQVIFGTLSIAWCFVFFHCRFHIGYTEFALKMIRQDPGHFYLQLFCAPCGIG